MPNMPGSNVVTGIPYAGPDTTYNYSSIIKDGRVDILGVLRDIATSWPPTVGQTFTLYGHVLTVNSIQDGYIYITDGSDSQQIALPYYPEKIV
jgi:hypothetical protein